MPHRSHAHRRGFRSLALAGAVALGLGGLLPLRAQESGRAANGAIRAEDPAIDRPDRERDLLNLKARLFEQRKATLRAEAAYHNAKLTRELAEFAVRVHVEVVFPQALAAIEDELERAQASLAQAKKYVEWAKRIDEKGYLFLIPHVSAELVLQKAEFRIEQAKSKKRVLVEYTKPKAIKGLKSEVEKARSDELAKQAIWELEKAKEAELVRQLRQPSPT